MSLEPSAIRHHASTQVRPTYLPQAANAPEGRRASTNNEMRKERVAQLYGEWKTAMCRWLSSRGPLQKADLDDVAQETFVRFIRYSDTDSVEYPQSYLFRMAINVVNENRERLRNKLPHGEEGLESLEIESHHEPENSTDRTMLSKQVQAALSQLSPRKRAIVVLHIREDLTYKQIATKLKLSPRVVRREISRAYAELRGDLSELSPYTYAK